MLLGCIELMRDADTPEHRQMFADELGKALFVAPAIVEPAPIEDEEGNLKLAPESKIQFPMLGTTDGKKLYMAFTDQKEYDEWQEANQKFPMFTLNLQDYANMLLRKDPFGNPYPVVGLVINPMSTNLVVSREMLGSIIAMKMAQDPVHRAMMQKAMQQAAAKKAAEEAANAQNAESAE